MYDRGRQGLNGYSYSTFYYVVICRMNEYLGDNKRIYVTTFITAVFFFFSREESNHYSDIR